MDEIANMCAARQGNLAPSSSSSVGTAATGPTLQINASNLVNPLKNSGPISNLPTIDPNQLQRIDLNKLSLNNNSNHSKTLTLAQQLMQENTSNNLNNVTVVQAIPISNAKNQNLQNSSNQELSIADQLNTSNNSNLSVYSTHIDKYELNLKEKNKQPRSKTTSISVTPVGSSTNLLQPSNSSPKTLPIQHQVITLKPIGNAGDANTGNNPPNTLILQPNNNHGSQNIKINQIFNPPFNPPPLQRFEKPIISNILTTPATSDSISISKNQNQPVIVSNSISNLIQTPMGPNSLSVNSATNQSPIIVSTSGNLINKQNVLILPSPETNSNNKKQNSHHYAIITNNLSNEMPKLQKKPTERIDDVIFDHQGNIMRGDMPVLEKIEKSKGGDF